MRFPLLLACLLLSAGTPWANAQEPVLPQPDTEPPPPAAPAPTVPQLIPDEVLPAATPGPSAPSLPQLDEAFKDNPLTQATAAYRARIEWRKLQNVVTNDPEVKAARAEAEAARTDLQKRKLLRRYYEIFFGKMIARASTPHMKGYLNDRKNEHLNTLPQPRVRPETVPAPTPQASPRARPQVSPSPSRSRPSRRPHRFSRLQRQRPPRVS